MLNFAVTFICPYVSLWLPGCAKHSLSKILEPHVSQNLHMNNLTAYHFSKDLFLAPTLTVDIKKGRTSLNVVGEGASCGLLSAKREAFCSWRACEG